MNLEKLNNIQRVEAPLYLFTRIQQKIEFTINNKFPKKIGWAILFSFTLIIVLNINMVLKYDLNTNETEGYVQSIHLISNNSLYK